MAEIMFGIRFNLFQPSEIIPAGKHFTVAAVLDKFPKGLLRLFLTAGMPITLDEVHPYAAVGLRKGEVVRPRDFIGPDGIQHHSHRMGQQADDGLERCKKDIGNDADDACAYDCFGTVHN